MKKLIAAALALLCLSACAGALSVMSDSIDAGRFALKTACHVETTKCEVARAGLNDAIAAYDLALAAQGKPEAAALEKKADDAINAFLATMALIHAPATSGGEDVDGGSV